MTHLYVIAGHGAGDPGAGGNGHNEAERVRTLAQRIKDLGGDDVTLHPFNDDAFASGALKTLVIPKDWQIVELHMDSASPSAKGAHVVINSTKEADDYDKALANSLSTIFPGRSNTIVKRDDLANPKRAAARGFNYRLAENGFISNAGDIATFNERIDDIARAYLSVFGIGMNMPAINMKEGAMQCIIQPNGEGRLVFYDGTNIHPLNHPDEVEAIQMVARATLGKDLPGIQLGSKEAPWATRFFEAVSRRD